LLNYCSPEFIDLLATIMKKLQYIFFISILFVLLIRCSNSRTTIEGRYYQQKIEFYATYDLGDSLLIELENMAQIEINDTLSEKDKEFMRMIKHAVEYNLLRRPFIRLKATDGTKLMLYMGLEEFNYFKDCKLSEIRKGEKVIIIKAKVKDISFEDTKIYDLIKFKLIDEKIHQ